MSKIWPQGSSEGEELRDNDIFGMYKPDDAPAIADGSLNKKKTLQSLRIWLETVIANFSTNNLTLTGLLTASGDGITSSTSTIALKKSTTIVGLSGTVEDRIDTNSDGVSANAGDISDNDTDILALQGRADDLETKTPQDYKTTDTITLADLIITGLGNIKATIQGLLDKVGQSLNPADDVVFNIVFVAKVRLADAQTGSVDMKTVRWLSSDTESTIYNKIITAMDGQVGSYGVGGRFGVLAIMEIERDTGTSFALHGNTTGTPLKTINQGSGTTMGSSGNFVISIG